MRVETERLEDCKTVGQLLEHLQQLDPDMPLNEMKSVTVISAPDGEREAYLEIDDADLCRW